MPTNKQRRDANRVRLQRQLETRRETEARRRKVTLITSIGATVVLIAAIVIVIVAVNSGKDDKKFQSQAGAGTNAASASASAPAPTAPVACAKPASGSGPVTFKGVTVKNPTDLKKDPTTTSTSTDTPAVLECQDLVVGTGAAATPTSQVKVQYAGVLYSNGTAFDSSWSRGGAPAAFSLTGVVPGFTQGIGGTGAVAPMKVGGRRILILPSALGYGAQGSPPTIPANASLVFVVDLTAAS